MTKDEIVRAWKDRNYRNQLTPEQRAALPNHPAGPVDLSEADLGSVAGACSEVYNTFGCCGTSDTCTGRNVNTNGCCQCDSDFILQ
jgi:mersacidin/lichenicidin family type 2 lantibiotic